MWSQQAQGLSVSGQRAGRLPPSTASRSRTQTSHRSHGPQGEAVLVQRTGEQQSAEDVDLVCL